MHKRNLVYSHQIRPYGIGEGGNQCHKTGVPENDQSGSDLPSLEIAGNQLGFPGSKSCARETGQRLKFGQRPGKPG